MTLKSGKVKFKPRCIQADREQPLRTLRAQVTAEIICEYARTKRGSNVYKAEITEDAQMLTERNQRKSPFMSMFK